MLIFHVYLTHNVLVMMAYADIVTTMFFMNDLYYTHDIYIYIRIMYNKVSLIKLRFIIRAKVSLNLDPIEITMVLFLEVIN